MTRILVTGGRGFLGRNLTAHLRETKNCELAIIDRGDSIVNLHEALLKADIIFHLAGVNRPHNPADFVTGNTELTEQMCQFLHESGCSPKIVFSSSIQAEMDNPYGTSKRKAETALRQFAADTGAQKILNTQIFTIHPSG